MSQCDFSPFDWNIDCIRNERNQGDMSQCDFSPLDTGILTNNFLDFKNFLTIPGFQNFLTTAKYPALETKELKAI